jgi:hypothetical protein
MQKRLRRGRLRSPTARRTAERRSEAAHCRHELLVAQLDNRLSGSPGTRVRIPPSPSKTRAVRAQRAEPNCARSTQVRGAPALPPGRTPRTASRGPRLTSRSSDPADREQRRARPVWPRSIEANAGQPGPCRASWPSLRVELDVGSARDKLIRHRADRRCHRQSRDWLPRERGVGLIPAAGARKGIHRGPNRPLKRRPGRAARFQAPQSPRGRDRRLAPASAMDLAVLGQDHAKARTLPATLRETV